MDFWLLLFSLVQSGMPRFRPLVSIGIRTILSVAIGLHFILIAITYAANHRRSPVQDATLSTAQPYLIAGNWYVELFPIGWMSSESMDLPTRIELSTESHPTGWETLLDSRSAPDAMRLRPLLRLFHALAQNEDSDGVIVLLHSLLNHALPNDSAYRSVRVVQIDPNSNDGSPTVIMEANIVRLDNSMSLVPKIESFRSVPSNTDNRLGK